MSVRVGDLVVYASHGIGRVESVHAAEDGRPAKIVVVFQSELRVTLPLARARDALRSLSGESELDEVGRTLRTGVARTDEPWSRRHRSAHEKLVAGRVAGLAEIVRDGLEQECRRASAINGRSMAPSDTLLYRQARTLLGAEIAACRGIATEEADAWIVEEFGRRA